MSSGINALYESRNGAQAAMATLIAAGIPDAAIRLVVGPLPPEADRAETKDLYLDGDTLRHALVEIGLPREAWAAYSAKLTAGGAMLNLAVDDAERERVLGILNDHGSVDPTQRVAIWREEGWGGTSPVSTEGWGGYSATSTGGKNITDSQG
ncbi:hypothetical protein MKL09_00370 [Methylobacterium sp. J-048]|uniref:hypothetical protein n=1 Tax=Methylobacterium sp. J-048 TaxID=2836635 RepID=UPI001FB8F99E|nr:hypothetical protein [Methylobacterium sp. J-048]MCJ2055016.1 hypothetical protein [Methylobacterium sp. J-048]